MSKRHFPIRGHVWWDDGKHYPATIRGEWNNAAVAIVDAKYVKPLFEEAGMTVTRRGNVFVLKPAPGHGGETAYVEVKNGRCDLGDGWTLNWSAS